MDPKYKYKSAFICEFLALSACWENKKDSLLSLQFLRVCIHLLCHTCGGILSDCEENYQSNKTRAFDLISDALKQLKHASHAASNE